MLMPSAPVELVDGRPPLGPIHLARRAHIDGKHVLLCETSREHVSIRTGAVKGSRAVTLCRDRINAACCQADHAVTSFELFATGITRRWRRSDGPGWVDFAAHPDGETSWRFEHCFRAAGVSTRQIVLVRYDVLGDVYELAVDWWAHSPDVGDRYFEFKYRCDTVEWRPTQDVCRRDRAFRVRELRGPQRLRLEFPEGSTAAIVKPLRLPLPITDQVVPELNGYAVPYLQEDLTTGYCQFPFSIAG